MVIYGFAIMITITIAYVIIGTLIKAHDKLQAVGEFTSVALLVIMEIMWSTFDIYNLYNGIILTNFGIVASFLIAKVIICSVTKVLYILFLDEIQFFPC